ncbi:PTS system mannose/fructose/sorbose family transporter subunit IID [Marinococcus sp. PL1-022]|uniref:PTS system mannose/fructose/sorbose family transporter subunit IID n=1 Tax=Marinococcus sp. PL1-022 TaxID=3095363 RepID=UPI0029C33A7B|nr:PTS system mannose/fructose/sorbose family transporter subunit IID [Marinococcus sp. PL1-022]MDX6152631.1 PTS system mannose/fructose/sorbose family transporter subunit IID [Marinococcus sp. PL1-022]
MPKLEKKDLRKSWLNWAMFHLSSMSFEKLEAHGFAHSMIPIAKKLYKNDPEEHRKALERHSVFYNVEPQVGSVINGITASMEEEKANGKEIDDEVFVSVKTSMMGPLSGIGDSTIQGILIPVLLSIAMAISAGGNPLGVLLYMVGYVTIAAGLSYFLYMRGYQLGVSSIDTIVGEGSERLRDAFNILGIIVIGGLAASFVSLSTPLEIPNGEESLVLQETLDSFFPGFLGLLAVIFSWYLISKRRISATKILLILIGISVVGVLLGIF